MVSKSVVKTVRSLHQKKYREELSSFVVEGSKSVVEFVKSSLQVRQVFATETWLQNHAEELTQLGQEVEVMTKVQAEQMSALNTTPEVLAVVQLPEVRSIDDQFFAETVLMLDDIKDPGNLGTIFRTADWFGIKNIVCSPETVDAYNPKVVQASMGSLSRLCPVYASLESVLQQKPQQVPVYGTFLQGEPLHNTTFPKAKVLVFGNESKGISPTVAPFISQRITIPRAANSAEMGPESLNVATAVSVVLYEMQIISTFAPHN